MQLPGAHSKLVTSKVNLTLQIILSLKVFGLILI